MASPTLLLCVGLLVTSVLLVVGNPDNTQPSACGQADPAPDGTPQRVTECDPVLAAHSVSPCIYEASPQKKNCVNVGVS